MESYNMFSYYYNAFDISLVSWFLKPHGMQNACIKKSQNDFLAFHVTLLQLTSYKKDFILTTSAYTLLLGDLTIKWLTLGWWGGGSPSWIFIVKCLTTGSCLLSLRMEHLNLTSGITSASKDWHDIITQRVHVHTKNVKTAWTEIDCLFSFGCFFPRARK